ncbi:hypothetical protein BWP39_20175 [Paraburkholderia acidicola]|uniref:Uncharacterized protein n=1 Tax=Paraburkholderia acidicola TaxID=1912599 RepID=A0A2A4ELT2_9BURK|nr:hypothetical protein [Paraburkholderia acidicola]PCE21991.1 hypothetical protein BWP39_20175 [Paraburkholderia acidicola]
MNLGSISHAGGQLLKKTGEHSDGLEGVSHATETAKNLKEIIGPIQAGGGGSETDTKGASQSPEGESIKQLLAQALSTMAGKS